MPTPESSRIVPIRIGSRLFRERGIHRKTASEFINFCKEQIEQGNTLLVVVGGGRLTKQLIAGAKRLGLPPETQDRLGIVITHINARVLANLLKRHDIAVHVFYRKETPELGIIYERKVNLGAGTKVGQASDSALVERVCGLGLTSFVNIVAGAGVFARNESGTPIPDQIIPKMTWSELKAMTEDTHIPGGKGVIGVGAINQAQECGLTGVFVESFEDLNNYLSGKSFRGTIVHP